ERQLDGGTVERLGARDVAGGHGEVVELDGAGEVALHLIGERAGGAAGDGGRGEDQADGCLAHGDASLSRSRICRPAAPKERNTRQRSMVWPSSGLMPLDCCRRMRST